MPETERELRKRLIPEIRGRLDKANNLSAICDPRIIFEISNADVLIQKYKDHVGGIDWNTFESDSRLIKNEYVKECLCKKRYT